MKHSRFQPTLCSTQIPFISTPGFDVCRFLSSLVSHIVFRLLALSCLIFRLSATNHDFGLFLNSRGLRARKVLRALGALKALTVVRASHGSRVSLSLSLGSLGSLWSLRSLGSRLSALGCRLSSCFSRLFRRSSSVFLLTRLPKSNVLMSHGF